MSIHSYQLLKSLTLSEAAVLRILLTINEPVFRAEQVIYRRAAEELPWTHIASGLVCAYLPSESADMEPFCVHPQGDWFGETDVIRAMVRECSDRDIEFLTLFAFSTKNWRRSSFEVACLMDLLRKYLASDVPDMQNRRSPARSA